MNISAFKKKVFAYYRKHKRDLPWRKTTDSYAILVSEVMLQQTQVDRVIPKYQDWMARFPTLRALAKASLSDVLRAWSGLGYNSRAKHLHELAKRVMKDHQGRIPEDIDSLQRLPGIGPYTSHAILIFAHNKDLATVDTNIRRILIHEFELSEKTGSEALQQLADRCVPVGRSRDWHNALMDYGATLLTARKTGIRPTSRQSRFEGSVRQARGRILKALIEKPRTGKELKSIAQKHSSIALNALMEERLVIKQGKKHVLQE